MLCQSCNHNEANMHFSTNVDGQIEERHLCEDCAKLESDLGLVMPISLGYILGGLMSHSDFEINETEEKICNKCGITYDRFLQTGKFGCSNCFNTFDRDISSLLKNIHGQDEHIGKIPSKSSEYIKFKREIEIKENLLNQAVVKEDFESAAKYRDEIKLLKKNNEIGIDNNRNMEGEM